MIRHLSTGTTLLARLLSYDHPKTPLQRSTAAWAQAEKFLRGSQWDIVASQRPHGEDPLFSLEPSVNFEEQTLSNPVLKQSPSGKG